MKSLPKILLPVAVMFGLLFFISPQLAKAQVPCPGFSDEACAAINTLFSQPKVGPWYDQNPNQFAAKVFGGSQDEIFGERYTYAQINWIINSIASMLNPNLKINNPTQFLDFLKVLQAALAKSQNGEVPTLADYSQLGPAGLFSGGITMLYANPPASGIQETKFIAKRIIEFGTGAEPVYAQGYGYNGLNSGGAVHALWTASRNMSYLIMVILLIAAGFLIMFKVKINPQTIVSLQTMIPKLIITMLLVTFSFAIAGLVIDLIYVAIVAFVGGLSLSGSTTIISDVPRAIAFLTASGFEKYFFVQIITPLLFWFAISFIIGTIASIASAGTLVGPATIGIVLVVIAVSVVYLITLFKIFWMLVKAYITIVLLICIGPLQIMLDLIPGQKGFGPWIRNVIANASVFAVVPIMLVIQNILTGDIITRIFLPVNGTFNSLGGSTLNLPFLRSPGWMLSFAGGFVLFTMTPKIADIIRDSLKIPPFKYGGAIGEALSPVARAGGGYVTNVGSRIVKDPTSTRAETMMGSITEATGQSISGLSNLGK